MNETGDNVTVLNGKVIVGTVDVGGDDGGEVTPVFFGIGSAEGVDEPFGRRRIPRWRGGVVRCGALFRRLGRLSCLGRCRWRGRRLVFGLW